MKEDPALGALALRPVFALESNAAWHLEPELAAPSAPAGLAPALALFHARDYRRAAAAFARAGSPGWEGACLLLLKEPASAEPLLRRALELEPGASWPALWLSALEAASGRGGGGARGGSPAMRLARALLAKVRFQRGAGSAPRARACLNRVCALRPWGDYAWAWRAELERDLGRRDMARALLDEGLSVFPASALLYAMRARLRGEGPEGRVDGACLADLDRALALRPGYAKARAWRGEALRKLGRPAEAKSELRRALAEKPDYALARTFLQKLGGRP